MGEALYAPAPRNSTGSGANNAATGQVPDFTGSHRFAHGARDQVIELITKISPDLESLSRRPRSGRVGRGGHQWPFPGRAQGANQRVSAHPHSHRGMVPMNPGWHGIAVGHEPGSGAWPTGRHSLSLLFGQGVEQKIELIFTGGDQDQALAW